MIVLVVESVTPGIRGYLTRWMVEVHTGVFVGNLSSRIRDMLWERVEKGKRSGGATLLWSDHTHPQGYRVRQTGAPKRPFRDFDGIQLPAKPLRR